jgi:hypothetical protein
VEDWVEPESWFSLEAASCGTSNKLAATARITAVLKIPTTLFPGIFAPVLATIETVLIPLYFKAASLKFPLLAHSGPKKKLYGNRTTAMRTGASLVTSRILSPFRLSPWLLAMK